MSYTLDSNVKDAKSASFNIAGKSKLTLYVKGVSGDHNNHAVTILTSPDNLNWFNGSRSKIGTGRVVFDINDNHAKIVVSKDEGSDSQIEVFTVIT